MLKVNRPSLSIGYLRVNETLKTMGDDITAKLPRNLLDPDQRKQLWVPLRFLPSGDGLKTATDAAREFFATFTQFINAELFYKLCGAIHTDILARRYGR